MHVDVEESAVIDPQQPLKHLETMSGDRTSSPCNSIDDDRPRNDDNMTIGRPSTLLANGTCNWCGQIRHSFSFVDVIDGGKNQLRFCSDKCLSQYKMHLFCTETQQHLQHFQVCAQGYPHYRVEKGGTVRCKI